MICLVEARDLEPWYDTPRYSTNPLDPALMAQARRDFGGMLRVPARLETATPPIPAASEDGAPV